MQRASLTPATSCIAPHRDGSGPLRLTIQARTSRVEARATTGGWTPAGPARSNPRRSPSSQGDARIPLRNSFPEQSSSISLPRVTRYARQRWDHPHHRQATGPTVVATVMGHSGVRTSAVSGTFGIVSRGAVTFPRRPRPTAHVRLDGSCVTNAGPGGSQRETAGGKRVRASPPMSRALWSGARRSASLPPRGVEDSVSGVLCQTTLQSLECRGICGRTFTTNSPPPDERSCWRAARSDSAWVRNRSRRFHR
jgi:hypothetical protein